MHVPDANLRHVHSHPQAVEQELYIGISATVRHNQQFMSNGQTALQHKVTSIYENTVIVNQVEGHNIYTTLDNVSTCPGIWVPQLLSMV